MVNAKIESMEVQKTGLLAQIRHLDAESYDLLLQIRATQENLSKTEEFEKRRILRQSGNGRSFPQNQDRDLLAPIKQELADLKTRRSIVLERLAKVRAEINDLGVLLDECRKYSGQLEPTRRMPVTVLEPARAEF